MPNLHTVALLMRDDLVTVHCAFNSEDNKEYTYVCEKALSWNLRLGDQVVVLGNKKRLQIVEVRQIDEECDVDINDSWEYAWIVQRINIESYEFNKDKTDRMVKSLKERQRAAARKQALASLGITDVAQLGEVK